MPLRDLLKKKDRIQDDDGPYMNSASTTAPPPEFTFLRTDTYNQEIIEPPNYGGGAHGGGGDDGLSPRKRHSRFRKHSNAAPPSPHSPRPRSPGGEKRLSNLLHLSSPKSRASSTSSVNLPADLPDIGDEGTGDAQEKEARWEERATILAQGAVDPKSPVPEMRGMTLGEPTSRGRSRSPSAASGRISDAKGDDDIQEAIRLHEGGDLTRSTEMFGRLADPQGQNNALSQVLYGLALRHGWGCQPDPTKAITYLQAAASNSAAIERDALNAGVKKGGAAKGELVLAIFELANCFRHGWGVEKDAVAARQYYETAANLGDTDAMNEAAWCYLEGFGGKKDKFVAAKYYRLAEQNGNKTLGNTWIWKDKYNPK